MIYEDDSYVKRVLLYTGGSLRGSLNRGESYEYMKNVIMINILDYTLFKDIKEYHTIWKLRENNNLRHEPLEDLEIYFLELEKFRKNNPNIHEKLNQWLAKIDTEKEKWLEVVMKENQKLKEVVEKKDNFEKEDNLVREIIEAQDKWELDYRVGVSCAKKEGHAAGLAEGIAEGYATGLAEGKLEVKKNLLKNLLKMNMDLDTISKVTGLTKDEIEKLKKEI